MRAVRLHGVGDLRVEDIPRPEGLGADEVRLRVAAAGICGSDLHNFATGQWITRAPSVAGHELCGVVEAVGGDVSHLAVGDHVVADSRVWCGRCDNCRVGLPQICETLGFVGEACDGGFAQGVVLPGRLLHKHDPSLDPRVATMAEPLAVALHALRRLNAPSGAPVLVVGCGTIGGLCAILLRRLHDGPILVADRNEARAGLVAGAVEGRSVGLDAGAVRDALDGAKLRHAIDATGNTDVIGHLVDLVDGGGAIALVGIGHGTLALDPNLLVEKETALVGCHAFADELPDAIAMLPALSDTLLSLIDETIGLADVPAAFARLLESRSQGLKTVIRIG